MNSALNHLNTAHEYLQAALGLAAPGTADDIEKVMTELSRIIESEEAIERRDREEHNT